MTCLSFKMSASLFLEKAPMCAYLSVDRMTNLNQFIKKPFIIMGILNVTPDSFYDGGRYNNTEAALDHARALIRSGADILDIGGESSRPGSKPVSLQEEIDRTIPVISAIRRESSIPLSIDTTKAAVAKAALDAGANWVNDISAGRFDPQMPSLVSRALCPVVLMHSRKRPVNMQNKPFYQNVINEVSSELLQSVDLFKNAGVPGGNILLDPGIGFAKRLEDNVSLIKNLDILTSFGYPVVLGTSRKSFIGTLIGRKAGDRLPGSLGTVAAAYYKGVKIFRVHDVEQTRDLLNVIVSIEKSK